MASSLPEKFLKGVQKIIAKAGFQATIVRQNAPTTDPSDPLGPPITTYERTTINCFIDEPQRIYRGGSYVGETQAKLYVDLLSATDPDTMQPRNTLSNVTWFTQLNDILERSDGTKLTLPSSNKPEASGRVVICIHDMER